MASNATPTNTSEADTSPVDQAFSAAMRFVEDLAVLAFHARNYVSRPDIPDAWQLPAMIYAVAFVAWFDLSHQLTSEVRTEAWKVYSPGSPSMKIGNAVPTPTVIEAVADELGVYFRNTVFAGRRHPLESDYERMVNEAKAHATARRVANGMPAEQFGWAAEFYDLMKKETHAAVQERMGIKTENDFLLLLIEEWNKQDRKRGESAICLLRCDSVDFNELETQLIREAEAVRAAASKPNASDLQDQLEAISVASEENRTGLERIAKALESSDPQDNDNTPTPKLPKLKPHDRQAWQLSFLHGMTQTMVADELNREHGTTYSQGQVSRMIARSKDHADASGLADKIPKPIDRPLTIDPSRLELGPRTDKRKARPSDLAREKDSEN